MLAFLTIFLKKYTQRTVQRMAAILCTCMIFFSSFLFFLSVQIWRYLVVVLHLIYLRYWTTEKNIFFSSFIFGYMCYMILNLSIHLSSWTVLCCKFLLFLMTSSSNHFYTFFSQHNLWIILIFMYTFMFSCILLDLNV